MTPKQKRVLNVFKEGGTMSPHCAAKKLNYEESAPITGCIKSLVKKGKLIQIQKGRWAKYEITKEI